MESSFNVGVVIFTWVACFVSPSWALQCYNCLHGDADSAGILSGLSSAVSNAHTTPNCRDPFQVDQYITTVTCGDATSCGVITLTGSAVDIIIRGCFSQGMCGFGAQDFPDGNMINATCCDTDHCNAHPREIVPEGDENELIESETEIPTSGDHEDHTLPTSYGERDAGSSEDSDGRSGGDRLSTVPMLLAVSMFTFYLQL